MKTANNTLLHAQKGCKKCHFRAKQDLDGPDEKSQTSQFLGKSMLWQCNLASVTLAQCSGPPLRVKSRSGWGGRERETVTNDFVFRRNSFTSLRCAFSFLQMSFQITCMGWCKVTLEMETVRVFFGFPGNSWILSAMALPCQYLPMFTWVESNTGVYFFSKFSR